jgi:hypothetical protein
MFGMPVEMGLVFEEAKASFVYRNFVAVIVLAAAFIEQLCMGLRHTRLDFEGPAENNPTVRNYSSISAFRSEIASTNSSMNSFTTARVDFTLSTRPTPWPTK